jgi:hypothetical protein
LSSHATITVLKGKEELQHLWQDRKDPIWSEDDGDEVTFSPAPGDRGTEIHISLAGAEKSSGPIAQVSQKFTASGTRAKAMDELRRFKQLIETGVIARSEGSPEGERVERKLKQRPAQPVSENELQKVGK